MRECTSTCTCKQASALEDVRYKKLLPSIFKTRWAVTSSICVRRHVNASAGSGGAQRPEQDLVLKSGWAVTLSLGVRRHVDASGGSGVVQPPQQDLVFKSGWAVKVNRCPENMWMQALGRRSHPARFASQKWMSCAITHERANERTNKQTNKQTNI